MWSVFVNETEAHSGKFHNILDCLRLIFPFFDFHFSYIHPYLMFFYLIFESFFGFFSGAMCDFQTCGDITDRSA